MAFAMHIPLTDKYKYAVESPVNVTTLNAKTEWSPILIRIEPQGSLPRRGPDTFTLWKIIVYCMQCLSYAMYSSTL